MQKNYPKKRMLNKLKISLLLLMMVCFAGVAQAQTRAENDIYMHNGTEKIARGTTYHFFDSQGPCASSNGANYWNQWYNTNENYTLTLRPKTDGDKIKVTFKQFIDWEWNNNAAYNNGNLALHINDDYLTAYSGTTINPSSLITELTGSYENEFSIMADGAITFTWVSNANFRGAGWTAEVVAINGDLQPQTPFIYKDKCDNLIGLYPTTLGSTMYYSTDGTNFAEYTAPISWPTNQENITVYAYSKIGNETSATKSLAFDADDRTPVPTKPTNVTRVPNTNTIIVTPGTKPSGLQETWYIGYTTAANGGTPVEPTLGNATWDRPHYFTNIEVQYDTIEVLTPNTSYRFKTRAYSCDQLISSEYYDYLFKEVYVPAPTITIAENGSTTLSMPTGFSDATVRYTTDGSDPTTSSTAQTYNGNAFTLSIGATVRTYAYKDPINSTNTIGYVPSAVKSDFYVPAGGSGLSDDIVLLDDREDHSWAYYSMGGTDNPIHSLNPKDVKITYFGNGIVMTGDTDYTNGATTGYDRITTGVAVGVDAPQNRFIYLKTLENENAEGTGANYPYTTIPNPFSKRPTYGTGNSRWRGFQGWRVKAVRGGSIGYAVGDIISAETLVNFQPTDEYGMEVEFEAVWARAYVATSRNTTLSGGSYERNFYVLTGAINGNMASPGTVSRYYPNGTTDGTTAVTAAPTQTQSLSDIDLSVDTKYEYIALIGTNNITANNHYLCFGRGISTSNTVANSVSGVGGDPINYDLDYTIRIESGTYEGLNLVRNGSGTANGTVHVNAILGCDYDRAANNNERLYMARTGSTSNDSGPASHMYFSRGYTLGSANRRHRTLDCFVKSGSYMDTPTGTNIVEINQTFYVGHTNANDCYPGLRYITVEGGNLLSITGGKGANSSTYAETTDEVFNLRMKGGTVRGCIVGGATMNPSYGSRSVIITGGTVKGWIAGGCNGTSSGGGRTVGHANFYIGGNAVIGENGTELCGVAGGNIFGAGRGNNDHGANSDTEACSIDGSNIVVADNAVVLHDVYGGGNYGYNRGVGNIYVFGGTVKGSVFGGSNRNRTAHPEATNITMKGGIVNGSIYGGSNTTGTITGLATVTMSGGTTTNVFGGGYGNGTTMSQNTVVNISGGTINNNVYGGGEEGTVTGNTNVTVSGGTMNTVFGAGKGSGNNNANVAGNTNVLVSGGTVNDVYGGGEEGTINSAAVNGRRATVTITGSNTVINDDVFGAGKMGRSTCSTLVTVAGGSIGGNVFGGAEGAQNQGVFHAGLKTVNILGGRIHGSVYGGSRNAHDALKLTGYNTSETNPNCVVNVSAGQIDMHVFAAGYYGNTYGSTYVFVGANAITGAPNHAPLLPTGYSYELGKLDIKGNVWAGGDWGVFAGQFGAPTVSGNSNVYVDGSSYDVTGGSSEPHYMNIEGSLMGCGTSCDAGNLDRILIVKDYGDVNQQQSDLNPIESATRSLNSIQRFKNVAFDNSHLALNGQGRYNSLVTTEKYSLYGIGNYFYMINGSTLVLKTPASELKSFGSVTCEDIYDGGTVTWNPTYTTVNYNGLGNLGGSDNKIRVEGGSYVEVKYLDGTTTKFGELRGFFHMMVIGTSSNDEATCAYARPKTSAETGNNPDGDEYQNVGDGGFVSYRSADNEYTADGGMVQNGQVGVQLRYVNHTPMQRGDTELFRVWQYGGDHHTTAEGMLLAKTDPSYTANDWLTVSCEVILPRWTSSSSYFRFETLTGNYAKIDYGAEVMTFNAASATAATTGDNWMYCAGTSQDLGNAIDEEHIEAGLEEINDNKDLNFGLVVTPGQGMKTAGYDPLIICDASNQFLASQEKPFECADYNAQPKLNFRLTYSNKLTANKTLDPVIIHLVQCHMEGEGENAHEVIDDYIDVPLVITTSTQITQGFETKQYAIMDKQHTTKESSDFIIVLPAFTGVTGDASTFKVKAFNFVPDVELDPDNNNEPVEDSHNVSIENATNGTFDLNSFGLTMKAGDTYDQKNVWETLGETIDFGSDNIVGKTIGKATGRTETGLNFTLWYNEQTYLVNQQTRMGTVTVTIELDKYVTGYDNNNQPIIGTAQFDVSVEVWRKGRGDNFYIDGIAGQDKTNYGKHPDRPAATFNFILNRAGYTNGDHIFIVNKVTIANNQMWDGTTKTHAKVYRYPGKHELFVGGVGAEDANLEYTGTLIDVTGNLILKGVSIDGVYAESQKPAAERDDKIYPETCSFNGLAEAPIIDVLNGGSVNLTTDVDIQSNFNNASSSKADALLGGAIRVEQGGMLRMNDNVNITGNYCEKGGGVFMDGGLIVSDKVNIYNNKVSAATTAAQSNVWLTNDVAGAGNTISEYKVVQLGTGNDRDEYDELVKDAELNNTIGIDKSFGEGSVTTDGFLAVVYSDKDDDPESYLDIPYAEPQNLIVHDLGKYKLEKYLDKHFLYWLETWVTFQTWNPYFESAEAQGYTPYMTETQLKNISTPEQLAWVISLANGENGVVIGHQNYKLDNVIVTNDIDMNAHIWVPMGTEDHPFAATFDGNGHYVKGMHSPLVKTQMGMFGVTDGAAIGNIIADVDFEATADNMGALIGTMDGGTLSNVEAAGVLVNKTANSNMGGLVGNLESGTVHSSFAVTSMEGGNDMGGLVGLNKGNLYNSYSNVTFTDNKQKAGLVGTNSGAVENCYVVTNGTPSGSYYEFAVNNGNGTIKNSYAKTDSYVGSGTTTGCGTYGNAIGVKEIGYMYGDNLIAKGTNSYVGNSSVTDEDGLTTYVDNHIPVWNGLLSALNQWVRNTEIEGDFSSWNRPITTAINSDLPVLAFPKDNAMGSTDGKFLKYTAFSLTHTGDEPEEDTFNNGIDGLLEEYNALENGGSIFHYGKATEVANVPGSKVKVTINEDAVLLQKVANGNNTPDFTATVGVTFDNSDKGKHSFDYWHNKLDYDWHFMSSSLSDAPMGIEYGDATGQGGDVSISSMVGNYFPNGLPMALHGSTKWDLYTYYEPEYHWINLKRRGDDHWHTDNANKIQYLSGQEGLAVLNNETIFVPGKGYMMAISQDSYLSSTGTLNKQATIALTNAEPLNPEYNKGWNLVGNPFQAYLDLDLVANSVQGPFYVYDAEIGNYVAYAVGQSMNTATPSRYIHPHQAFFMKASSNTITFVPTMATATKLDDSYFRGDEQVNYPLVNLFVENERGNRDLAVIEFNRPEIGGATKVSFMNSATFSVAAHLEGGTYGLLFVPEGTERVPVYFGTEESGTFTITWDKQNGDFTSLLLVDNMTGTITDMLRADSYTFDATTDDYASRFYITYRVTAVDENVDGDGTFAFFDGSAWIVEGKGMLDVVDVMGRTLYSERLVNDKNRVSLNGVAAGVYLLRVSDGTNTMVQKIVVK